MQASLSVSGILQGQSSGRMAANAWGRSVAAGRGGSHDSLASLGGDQGMMMSRASFLGAQGLNLPLASPSSPSVLLQQQQLQQRLQQQELEQLLLQRERRHDSQRQP